MKKRARKAQLALEKFKNGTSDKPEDEEIRRARKEVMLAAQAWFDWLEGCIADHPMTIAPQQRILQEAIRKLRTTEAFLLDRSLTAKRKTKPK
jgi:hypothetical protein